MHETIQIYLIRGSEFLIVANLVLDDHPKSSFGHYLALYLNCSDGVWESAFFCEVFGYNFFYGFVLWVKIIGVLVFSLLLFLLLSLSLDINQYIFWIAGKGHDVEIVCFRLVEFIRLGEFFKSEIISSWLWLKFTSSRKSYSGRRSVL